MFSFEAHPTGLNTFCMTFLPGPAPLLATTGGPTVKLIDVARRRVLRGQLRGHRKAVYGIAFTPDGRWLASVGQDGTARLWDPRTRKASRVFDWGVGPLHCVGFSADGMLAAAGSAAGHVVVWDMDDE